MDRKPVWINGRQIYVLPWARGWDVLMAAPADDFMEVWNGRAVLSDELGHPLSPGDELAAGQKIFVRRTEKNAS